MPRTTVRSACRSISTALVLVAAAQGGSTAGAMQDGGYRSLLAVAATSTGSDAAPLPPANLILPSTYRELVSEMWRRSPAFRRQARRLADETALVVRVYVGRSGSGGQRATTRVKRLKGRVEADIQIGDVGSFVELLAHEIEHVLEQLDRVDLTVAARRTGGTVWITGDGSFETVRAIHVGRQVAGEVRGFVR
jgi:hypothetical protein